jgi:hypothetical protein
MSKEQEELLGEAFKNYLKDLMRDNVFKDDPNYILLSKEEFIKKCKTDNEFSERWGLKIDERELSLEERATIWNNTHNPVGNIYTHNQYDENDIPTKLITITYNDKTIESYENNS